MTTTTPYAPVPVKSPNVPLPPTEYKREYFDRLLNSLGLYFNQIDSFAQLFNSTVATQFISQTYYPNGTDNAFINAAYIVSTYGSFNSRSTQTLAVVNTPGSYGTPQKVTLQNTDFSNGIALNGNNGITFPQNGLYNIQYSIQLSNSSSSNIGDVQIYLVHNGVIVPNSNSVVSVTTTHGGNNGHIVIAANFFIRVLPKDYIELWWNSTYTTTYIEYVSGLTPASPSVVVTASYVSN